MKATDPNSRGFNTSEGLEAESDAGYVVPIDFPETYPTYPKELPTIIDLLDEVKKPE